MALWLVQWPGRQRVGGPSGTQGGSPWRDLCQSSEVSVGYSRGPGGAATSCVPGCGSRPTACWPALSSVRVGAAQLWWAAPWVGLGGNRSPQGVGTDDAGIAEPTRGDGHVEVGFSGTVVWIRKGWGICTGPGPYLSSLLLGSQCPAQGVTQSRCSFNSCWNSNNSDNCVCVKNFPSARSRGFNPSIQVLRRS